MSRARQAADLPYGLPKILDLTSERVRRTRDGLAEILFVARPQLREALRGLDKLDEFPRPGGRPLIQFVPYGSGFLGIPVCPSGDGRTCWPMKGGPDDNPFASVCVCRVDQDPRQVLPRPPCYLDFSTGPFRMRCARGSCKGTCRLGVVSGGKGSLQTLRVGCLCSLPR